MRIRLTSFAFAAVSLLLILDVVPFVFASDPQWVEVRSPHFCVVTDAGEKRGREVAIKFEQMRAVFGALLIKARVNLPVPLQIIAFRNTKEMRQFSPLWHGKPIQFAGLFQGGGDRNFILLDMSVEDPWIVVFHEYAHQLLNGNIAGETQPWFEEGFAEYFSTIDVDNKQAKVGYKAPPGDWQVLQQYNLMKVSDLFQVRHDTEAYNEGDRRSVFYAESWLVVHYLYDTQQVPKLAKYFDSVFNKKLSIEDAIQQSFGMSAAQFDKTLRRYMGAGQLRYLRLPTPPGIETTGYTVTPISLADAKAVGADMHLHSLDYQAKALEEFEEVLKMQPDNAAALRGLGYASLEKSDFARAADYFRKAAQSDSKDPRVHYYSALLMNREGFSGHDTESLQVMKRELLTSISLDPTFADAYSLLALAYTSSNEQPQAVEAMKKAVELDPRNEAYLYNLSLIYLNAKKVEEAIPLLRSLQNSSNPEIRESARESLEQAETMKAAMQAGQPGQSEAHLVERVATEHVDQPTEANMPTLGTNVRPPQFLKGKLVAVDCSAAPSALLTVISGNRTWKMKVPDSKHVIIVGADNFSCDWTNRKVALNYHPSGEAEGTVMSIEIQ